MDEKEAKDIRKEGEGRGWKNEQQVRRKDKMKGRKSSEVSK